MPKPEPTDVDLVELTAALVPGSGRPYPMTEELQSRVYGLDAGDERYVLRLCGDRVGFDKDAYATRFHGPGLPIPDVEAIGELGAYAYCLSTRLPGMPVNQVATDALAPVVDALIPVLHDIWERDVGDSTGFGPFDHTGNGAFASWRDYLVDPAPVEVVTTARRVPPDWATRLHGFVVDRADDCPDGRSLLQRRLRLRQRAHRRPDRHRCARLGARRVRRPAARRRGDPAVGRR